MIRLLQSTRSRLALVVAVLGLGAIGVWYLASYGPGGSPFICLFHEVTGLHCPGCGMTRATHALLEGRIFDAFRFNPVGLILLPIAILALTPEVVGWIKGHPPRSRFRVGRWGGVALATLIIGFTILRNLPWMPFQLLAPP